MTRSVWATRTMVLAGIGMAWVGISLAAGDSASGKTERREFPGKEIAIHDLAGDVRIEQATGSNVVVLITRGGKDAARLKIETDIDDGKAALRVVYPGDSIVYPAAGTVAVPVHVSPDGKIGEGNTVKVATSGDGLEAWADMVIQVPAGKDLSVSLGAGRLHVANVKNRLRLAAINGTVEAVETQDALAIRTDAASVTVRGSEGKLNVESVSGDISLSAVKGPKMTARTATGKVTVAVNESVGTQLSARTQDGTITSHVGIQVQDRRRLEGKIGDGANRLSIESEKGDIEVTSA